MSQDITFLTPGSVWLKADGTKSTVLCITNGSLPAKALAKFPTQVVYFNETGDVLSQTADHFMERRRFHNVDPDVESAFDALVGRFVVEGDADAEVEEGELVIIAGDSTEDGEAEEAPNEPASDEPAVVGEAPFVEFRSVPNELEKQAQILSDAVVSYSQHPLINEGYIAHVLEFDRAKLSSMGITPQGLDALFNPESGVVLPVFAINGDYIVDWTAFLGVFPKMSRKKSILCLHLGVEVEATPAATQVEIDAVPVAAVSAGDPKPAQIKVA